MMQSFHCLKERYCPVLGRNVAVQTWFEESGKTETCLFSDQCRHSQKHCRIHHTKSTE